MNALQFYFSRIRGDVYAFSPFIENILSHVIKEYQFGNVVNILVANIVNIDAVTIKCASYL